MKDCLKGRRRKDRIKLSVLSMVESPTGVPWTFIDGMHCSVFS